MVLSDQWQIIEGSLNAIGQPRVVLADGAGNRKEILVAHLVLLAFVGPCPSGMECIHDPDPSYSNCNLANIDWGIRPRVASQSKECLWCGRTFFRGKRLTSDWKKIRCCSVRCSGRLRRKTGAARPDRPNQGTDYPSREELSGHYEERNLTIKEVGALYGVSVTVTRRWLRDRGIQVRHPGVGLLSRGIEPPDRDTLNRLIHQEFKTYQQVADIYGVDLTAVPYWLTKHGIPKPSIGNSRRKGIAPVLPDADTLRSLYESGKSMRSIGRIYDLQDHKISELCDQYGIEKRPSGFNNQNGERYRCNDGRLVRSSYEKRVADWLHGHGIAYEYEPRLPFGRNCLGDFLANGWFIEVWGIVGSERYDERKSLKINGYNSENMPLINLTTHYFRERNSNGFETQMSRCLTHSGYAETPACLPIRRLDPSELERLYVEQSLTTGEIGGMIGVHKATISRWMIEAGIPRRIPKNNRQKR